ncbi:hypothetical protein [Sphingomonas adhaesiva]|uniref:hypothetical protein n=1 Tax=Sphingomonas adhaesiva TaxID=28212 RepID=UPI002FF6EF76
MLFELCRLNRVLAEEALRHEEICSAEILDHAALMRVRWRIAHASGRRLKHLTEVVLPAITRQAAPSHRERLAAFEAQTLLYRQEISGYVSRWLSHAIAADFDGYRCAMQALRDSVCRRIAEEQRLFGEVLVTDLPRLRTA